MKGLVRDPNPRYWIDDPKFGRLFDMSLWLADNHWPDPLRIDGRAYRRRTRRRRS